MAKLNIKVKYLALYRPQAIGTLERQHRPLKDSLKAAIEDMGEKYQDRWMEFLPLVLLGRRTAFQQYQCISNRAHFRDKFKNSLSTSFGPFGGEIYPQ